MKTFRKSSLISSVALLLVAIVALSGATFAWFSTKTTATASALSAKTTQGSNLMISEAKDTGWTQTLTFANTDTTALNPVTTNDLNDWYTADAAGYDTIVAADGYTAASATDVLSQIVYVKYDAEAGQTKDLSVVLTPTANAGSTDYYRVAVRPVTNDTTLATSMTDAVVYADANVLNDEAQYAQYATQSSKTISLGTIEAKDAEGAQLVYGYEILVWFEGDDIDCKDSNAVNDISLALSFQ